VSATSAPAPVREPITPESADALFEAMDDRLNALDALCRAARGLDIPEVSEDGQSLALSFTDGTPIRRVNLPLAPYDCEGDWAPGVTYALRDLVTYARGSYVCAQPHVAGAFADDLAAGRWLPNAAPGRDAMPYRGVYDPTAVYADDEAVLYTADGGLTWQLWRMIFDNGGRPPGTAPGAVDPVLGTPIWAALTQPQARRVIQVSRLAQAQAFFTASTDPVGVRVSFPRNLAGSQCVASVAPDRDVTIPLTKGGVAVGTVTIAKGARVGTFSCAPFVLLPGESLATGQAVRSTPLGYDLTFAFVGVTD